MYYICTYVRTIVAKHSFVDLNAIFGEVKQTCSVLVTHSVYTD